jgi:hypothetical protein
MSVHNVEAFLFFDLQLRISRHFQGHRVGASQLGWLLWDLLHLRPRQYLAFDQSLSEIYNMK